MQYIFLSHDVDWRFQGPSIEHILARKDRFEEGVINNIKEKNPYHNLEEFMEIEDSFGIKSTFFFRTKYENGNLLDYEDDLKSLVKGGWEIGLHSDPLSINDEKMLLNEKKQLEELTKTVIKGNRVHFLNFNEQLPKKLSRLGFVYDSTIRKSKDKIDQNEMSHFYFDKLIEFPVTLMDAYLFTYMKIKEEQIVDVIKNTIETGRNLNNDFNVITINWHNNVLKMKGGRKYKDILEFLTSQNDIKIFRGIDLSKIVLNQT